MVQVHLMQIIKESYQKLHTFSCAIGFELWECIHLEFKLQKLFIHMFMYEVLIQTDEISNTLKSKRPGILNKNNRELWKHHTEIFVISIIEIYNTLLC